MSVRLRPAAPGDGSGTPSGGSRAAESGPARTASGRPSRWGRLGGLLALSAAAVLLGPGSPDSGERTLANGTTGEQILDLNHRDAEPVLTDSASVVAVASVTASASAVSPSPVEESLVLRLSGP